MNLCCLNYFDMRFFKIILSGLVVSTTGIAVWSAALHFIPAPWSIPPMIVVLWCYWRLVSKGKKWRSLGNWKWGLAGAGLFVLIVQASFVLTFRLIPFPAAAFTADYKALDRMPLWVAWATLIMGSVVAGICEEAGFRGYIQAPLEKRYGPTLAIVVTSVLFMLIHLSHTWAYPILPHIFFASVLLGILAYRSGSLIPGIIGHSMLDIFDYSIWWTDLTGGFRQQPIFKTGVDMAFIFWCLVFLLAGLGFWEVMKKFYICPDDSAGQPTF
jgi:membrane protease YdiL (CAAX protease family)